jgi:DNA helicase HerA-like ATPase
MKEKFIAELQPKYTFSGSKLVLGKALLNNEVVNEIEISVPLKTINRHGLIAGATGTGKTKSLQVFVEQLSNLGIPSLVMDIKGDFSGIAKQGSENPKISERHEKLQIPYQTQSFPVELLTISGEKGVKLRATLLEFGPVLFSKILGLNDTQQSIVSVIFKYCEDKKLPLIDLEDLKQVLRFVTENEQGKQEFASNYGAIASSSLGAILRSIVALEQQGATQFFGEPSFEVEDLLNTKDGFGVVNIIRLTDIQAKPSLFSTFMLSLLAEIYEIFPEQGDKDVKLAIFIDEAHLIFKEASKVLLEQIETIIKLIRSKGVGVYFITQVPADIPEAVLSQLGIKIQHALRGVTAKDKKEIDKAVENYPISEFYDAKNLIQNLGIGETFITCLDEKGIPTPLAHTFMIAPKSRMDVLTTDEIDELVENSKLVEKYAEDLNKETAYELLIKKMDESERSNSNESETITRKTTTKEEPSVFSTIMNSPFVRDIGRTAMREGTKMFFGMLGLKSTRRR